MLMRSAPVMLDSTGPTGMLPSVQNECKVSLNTVESIEGFTADINHGRWDAVLPQVANLKLPRSRLEELYEQVFACSHHHPHTCSARLASIAHVTGRIGHSCRRIEPPLHACSPASLAAGLPPVDHAGARAAGGAGDG